MARRPLRRIVTPSDGPLFRRSPEGPAELARFAPCRAPLALPEAPGSRPVTEGGLDRWRLREALRPVQPWRRQRLCGRTALGPVQIGPGWIVGLAQCGSVHACPVCSAKLRAERATEIRALVAAWRTAHPEGGAGLLTLTVRHAWGTVLSDLRHGLAGAWRRLWQGSSAAELRRPIAHLIRAVDSTYGAGAGWHPHLHVLVFYPHAAPGEEWRAELAARWAIAVDRELGGRARPREDDVGVRWDPVVRSDYLLKLGLEIAGGEKQPRLKGRDRAHPWAIAREASREWVQHRGDASRCRWVQLWRDYARDMRGARALTWSHGTHRLAERAVEREEPPELTATPWALIVDGADWTRTMLYRGVPHELPELLQATTIGPEATTDLLLDNGCKAVRMAVTPAACLLTMTGGIFSEPNLFAQRRFSAESGHRNKLDRPVPSGGSDRNADAVGT